MKKFGHQGEVPKFTGRMKLTLAVFGITFAVLVWGLVTKQWWFDNMTALFLACAIIMPLHQESARKISWISLSAARQI